MIYLDYELYEEIRDLLIEDEADNNCRSGWIIKLINKIKTISVDSNQVDIQLRNREYKSKSDDEY